MTVAGGLFNVLLVPEKELSYAETVMVTRSMKRRKIADFAETEECTVINAKAKVKLNVNTVKAVECVFSRASYAAGVATTIHSVDFRVDYAEEQV